MKLLMDAFEYNAWATRQLGDMCKRLPAEQLTEKKDWQYQPIIELWRHVNQVERAYLRLMGVADLPEPAGDLDSYLQSAAACREEYTAFTAALDDSGMERTFDIPWFGREFTVADGLFQVVAHSIEHRADIAHFLSRFGYETPPIDYIAYVYLRDGGVMPG